jgi:hypothetical protein
MNIYLSRLNVILFGVFYYSCLALFSVILIGDFLIPWLRELIIAVLSFSGITIILPLIIVFYPVYAWHENEIKIRYWRAGWEY